MFDQHLKKSERLIRLTGDRVTKKRIFVLAILLTAQQAMTHREIEQRLNRKQRFDRVTIYRILEWLNKHNLVHKISSDDRVWRYGVNVLSHTHRHAHFKCSKCTKVICLDNIVFDLRSSLPLGYQFHGVDLTVKGVCAECI